MDKTTKPAGRSLPFYQEAEAFIVANVPGCDPTRIHSESCQIAMKIEELKRITDRGPVDFTKWKGAFKIPEETDGQP